MDLVLFFAPFCLITIACSLLMNRYGWRIGRVLFRLALTFAITFAEIEIAWTHIIHRAPSGESLLFAFMMMCLFLSPLIMLLAIAGWICYLRGYNPIWSICACLALYVGGYAWLVLWIRAPQTPDLTKEQAKTILLSRPEFRSQGQSPSIRQLKRSSGSDRDRYYIGHFSFVTKKANESTMLSSHSISKMGAGSSRVTAGGYPAKKFICLSGAPCPNPSPRLHAVLPESASQTELRGIQPLCAKRKEQVNWPFTHQALRKATSDMFSPLK